MFLIFEHKKYPSIHYAYIKNSAGAWDSPTKIWNNVIIEMIQQNLDH